jgi:hypothetical protein
MRSVRGRAFKVASFVVLGVTLAALTPAGCHIARYAEAATRSTRQFRASPIDARVAYEPGAEALAEVVASALPAAIETVETRQAGAFAVPVRVYVCATVESFARYGADRRAGGFTTGHKVFLSPKPENTAERVPRILTHELSHLHLGARRSILTFSLLPVWFVEGLGVEVSGGGGAEGVTDAEVRKAIAEGRAFVPEAEGSLLHPKAAAAYGLDAHMFYAQAGMFVGSLRSLDSLRFEALLRSVESGEALGPAFENAYGFPIDVAWRRFVDGTRSLRGTW